MTEEKSFGDATYRDKPDMSYIWLRHLDRTNLASANAEGNYDAYVEQQFRLLPSDSQKWVLEMEDEFREEKLKFVYEYDGGIRIGSEYDPLLWDELKPVKRLPDGSVDWDDPNIMSPKRVKETVTDYSKYNLIILMAAEEAGLSWNTETFTRVTSVKTSPPQKTPTRQTP